MQAEPGFHEVILAWRERAIRILGLNVVYKDRHRLLCNQLPRRAWTKAEPACMHMKRRDGQRPCFADCLHPWDHCDPERKEPVVHTCHAGLCEYRTPVVHDQQVVGVWMIGPIRAPRAARPREIPAAIWDALPTTFPAATVSVAEMLAEHTTDLADRRQDLLQHVEVSHACPPAIRRALETIRVAPRADLRAKDLAQRVGYSAVHFSNTFKQATGRTFSEFRHHLVMQRAEAMLANPERPVRAIADRLGFSSASYFTKAFRRHHGSSPSDYRRELLAERSV